MKEEGEKGAEGGDEEVRGEKEKKKEERQSGRGGIERGDGGGEGFLRIVWRNPFDQSVARLLFHASCV